MLNKLLLQFDYRIVTLEPKPNVISPITNRYYSDVIIDTTIKEHIKPMIKKGHAFGELRSLPQDDNPYSLFGISSRNVSHSIVKIWKFRGNYKALIKITTMSNAGKALSEILTKYPDKVRFTIRGAGSVTKSPDGTHDVVNKDLRIITWDASPTTLAVYGE